LQAFFVQSYQSIVGVINNIKILNFQFISSNCIKSVKIILLFLPLILSVSIFAQGNLDLTVKVFDSQGRLIPNATVSLVESSTNATEKVKTNSLGIAKFNIDYGKKWNLFINGLDMEQEVRVPDGGMSTQSITKTYDKKIAARLAQQNLNRTGFINKTLGIISFTLLLFSFAKQKKLTGFIALLNKSETSAQYLSIGNKFKTLQPTDSLDWYPHYYAAYSYALSAFTEKESSKIDSTLDLAQESINKAKLISPNNDEILCVSSMVYSARIMVNPQERGYTYGQKSSLLLQQALLLNENNPRTLYLIGQSKMYMPLDYGGGCKNAKPYLEKALKKFEAFKKKDVNAPDWGKKETQSLLGQCH